MAEYMSSSGPPGAGQAAAAFSVADGDSPPMLDMAFDTGALHALRAEVQAQARRAGFPDSRSAEMVLALHELATNAVRHGGGAGRLRIWNLAGAWRCQVDDGPLARDDPGPGAGHQDSEAAGAKGRCGLVITSSGQATPGHGLWVVRQVADQMQVLSGPHGTSATVTFDLPRGPRQGRS
jgi:anti-sigma regulatory factor (Ser/Thr protein kinase)